MKLTYDGFLRSPTEFHAQFVSLIQLTLKEYSIEVYETRIRDPAMRCELSQM